jgi:hypothetical protein
MIRKLTCPALAIALLLASHAAALAAVAPPIKPYEPKTPTNTKGTNKGKTDEPAKPEPVVIKFQSAKQQKLMGSDVMVISGTEVLTGKPRQFGVENEEPQNKNKAPKYDPKSRVAEVVKDMKPGDYLKIEPKETKNSTIAWVDKAEAYVPAEHEEEPGVYVLYEAYKKEEGGTNTYVVSLTKFAKFFDCYAPMVQDEKKNSVPDPEIVRVADAAKKKDVLQATITQQGKFFVVTSLDPYQAKQEGKFGKVADADVAGQKGQAVEVEQDGKSVTLLLPGKLSGKRWVTDPGLLADAKKMKPGTAVEFHTREVEGKTYLRQLAAAPKEMAKPAAKASAGAGKEKEAMTPKGKDAEAKGK